MKQSFVCKVVNGQLVYVDARRYKAFMDQVEGNTVDVKIEVRRRKRTLDQNAYWYGVVCKCLSDYLGYTKEEVNDLVEQKFLMRTLLIEGERYGITNKVKNLSTLEFNELKEQVQQWCVESFNLYIPDPDEQII